MQPLAEPKPTVCACGAAFEMELERDLGQCVDCAWEAAKAAPGVRP